MDFKILSIERLFESAMELEEKAEQFYRICAEKYAGTEIHMLLLQLADEEAAHQNYIETLRSSGPENFTVQYIENTPGESLQKFEYTKEFNNMISVMEYAIQLENASAEYYRLLGLAANGRLAATLTVLEKMERLHAKMLTKMLKELTTIGDDPGELHAH